MGLLGRFWVSTEMNFNCCFSLVGPMSNQFNPPSFSKLYLKSRKFWKLYKLFKFDTKALPYRLLIWLWQKFSFNNIFLGACHLFTVILVSATSNGWSKEKNLKVLIYSRGEKDKAIQVYKLLESRFASSIITRSIVLLPKTKCNKTFRFIKLNFAFIWNHTSTRSYNWGNTPISHTQSDWNHFDVFPLITKNKSEELNGNTSFPIPGLIYENNTKADVYSYRTWCLFM